jgi:hypothetical protein
MKKPGERDLIPASMLLFTSVSGWLSGLHGAAFNETTFRVKRASCRLFTTFG